MNRAQRRLIDKNKKNIYSNTKLIRSVSKQIGREGLSIPEGTKVQFNIKKMKEHPDWDRLESRYQEFVEQNVNTIFTVEYDNQYQKDPLWVCLAEDTNPIKWLFYIGDLKVVK